MKTENRDPLISVIVPVYRVERYLRECIDSILAQTYSNLEIILVDDGSDDGSGTICDRYAAADQRVTVFHIAHCGLSAARNHAMARAHGEWLAFVDSDDWIEPDMIRSLYMSASQYNADVVSGGLYEEFLNGTIPWDVPEQPCVLLDPEERARAAFLEKTIPMTVWNKLYRAKFFEDSNLWFPVGCNYEDAPILTEVILHSARLLCLPERYYHYRKRKNSITGTPSMKHTADYWHMRREQFFALRDTCASAREYFPARLMETVSEFYKQLIARKDMHAGYMEFAETLGQMQAFCKEFRTQVNRPSTFTQRILLYGVRHNTVPSRWILHSLYGIYSRIRSRSKAATTEEVFFE